MDRNELEKMINEVVDKVGRGNNVSSRFWKIKEEFRKYMEERYKVKSKIADELLSYVVFYTKTPLYRKNMYVLRITYDKHTECFRFDEIITREQKKHIEIEIEGYRV